MMSKFDQVANQKTSCCLDHLDSCRFQIVKSQADELLRIIGDRSAANEASLLDSWVEQGSKRRMKKYECESCKK